MKVRFYSSLFVCLLLATYTFAQKPVSVKMDEGTKLLDAEPSNNGLVLLTGSEYYFRSNLHWKITYYNPDLSVRYEVPIKKANLGMSNNMVVSPSGNSVYMIQYKSGLFQSWNKQSIMSMDSAGSTTTFDIKKQFKMDRVNVVFSDDHYLYYVTKEKDKTKKHKRGIKDFPKLQYVRVSKDNTVSKVWLDLPEPEQDATEWSYLGNTSEVAYFVSKSITEVNKATYRIGVIDADGQLEDDFKMEVLLKDGQFMAGYNHTNSYGAWVVDNHNILVTTSTYTSGNTTYTTTTYTARPEAFGDIGFDQLTNGFYIYGLSGPKPAKAKGLFAKRVKPEASNFYVYKFDQDGKKSWDYQGKLVGIDDYYRTQASFMARNLQLNMGPGGTTRFQTFSKENANTYELNTETGKYIGGYANRFENYTTTADMGTCHKPGDKSEMGKFLSKNDKGNFSMFTFRLYTNDIVLKNFFDDEKIELYKFGDE